ncbi:hypothetical protein [Saccharothrix australiensis]|uniref:Uncharacterized protein n=1 Tax=Saccharothrix australiensis TaxID=2072 RepID=A0A495VU46_9PSEU|nr:hypothetical protein [Saccharothrix australiensis]RKT52869.1 hypothetical protein C8E97_1409 [Saccharothrix australiensis]
MAHPGQARRDGTRESVEAFARYLDRCRDAHLRSRADTVRDWARALAEADRPGAGDERHLALAEVRDRARVLAFALTASRGDALKAAGSSGATLEHVVDGQPYLGDDRLGRAQSDYHDAHVSYAAHSAAAHHARLVVRGLSRDLARAAAAGRAGGVSRVCGLARRLVECALRLWLVPRPAARRRRCWARLDELGRCARPRSAQLGYALQVLVRGTDLDVGDGDG